MITSFTPKRTTGFTRLVLGIALGAACAAPVCWAQEDDDDEDVLDVTEIYFELNDTDGDLGIHGLIDGDAWERLRIYGPDERQNVKVKVRGDIGIQGLTEFFFESAEPQFADLPPAVFFDRFPEGEYEAEARTIEGDELEGETELTHLLPAPPANVRISGEGAAENCDVELPVVGTPVVISWDPVTTSHSTLGRTGEPVEVVQYQLVLERDEPTELVLSVDLPPEVTQFTVPDSFIALSDEWKFEILVREESHNQTALESCFEID